MKKRTKVSLLFAAIGPGIVTGLADTDAQGVSTYTVLGARGGYMILWGLVAAAALLFVTQEMGARLGLITEKGLAELIRERFGVRVVTLAMLVMIIANLGTVIADFAGIAASFELLAPGARIWGPIVVAIAIYFVIVAGSYRHIERVFLAIGIFVVGYATAAVMSHPNWGEALDGTFIPRLPNDKMATIAFIAAVGTTVTVWGQFFIQSSVVDKGLDSKHLKFSRIDVGMASILAASSGWFIALIGASVLHPKGIRVEDAKQAAIALEPLISNASLARILFGAGLGLAGILGVAVVCLATAYTACEGFGWETGLGRTPRQAPQFFGLLRIMLGVGVAAVLVKTVSLVEIMVLSNLANTIGLPPLLYLVNTLARDRDLLGAHASKNLRWISSWVVVAALLGLDVLLVVTFLR